MFGVGQNLTTTKPFNRSWFGRLQFLYHSNFSRVSISILIAIAVLPIAGALIVVGFVGTEFVPPSIMILQGVTQLAGSMGWWLLGNISLLFALVIGAAWSRNILGGVASSLLVFVVANYFTGFIFGITAEMLSVSSVIVVSVPHTIQTPLHFISVLGFPALNMGIVIGIVSGALGAFAYNSYGRFAPRNAASRLNPLTFIRGALFIGVVGIVSAIFTGAIFSAVFPVLQYLIYIINDIVLSQTSGTPYLLSFIYGSASRLLFPFGLSHIDTVQISYAYLNGTYTVATGSGAGDILRNQSDIWSAWISDLGSFRDPASEFFSPAQYDASYSATHLTRFSTSATMLNNFALAAAILAIFRSIDPNVRSSYRLIFIGGFFTILLTGNISSVGFLLLFLSPILYIVYILFSGVASVLMDALHIHIYSNNLIELLRESPSIFYAGLGNNIAKLALMGILYGAFVYYIFIVLISRLRIDAPGRGFNIVLSTLKSTMPTTCSMDVDSGRTFHSQNVQLHGETPDSWQYDLPNNTTTPNTAITPTTLQNALGGNDNILSLQMFHSGIIATVQNTDNVAPATQWKLNLGAIGVITKENTVQIIYAKEHLNNLQRCIRQGATLHSATHRVASG